MTDELPEKCCGRCVHYLPETEDIGFCHWPMPNAIRDILPSSVSDPDFYGNCPEEGTSCPCFEPKETPE